MARKLKIVNSVWVGEGVGRRKLGPGSEDEIVAALPKERVDELIASGSIIDESAPDASSVEAAEEKSAADEKADAEANAKGSAKSKTSTAAAIDKEQ